MERPVVPAKGCPSSLGKGQSLDEKGQPLECAVCLQTCVHPVQLQCRHIFCFLCVKGVAIQSKRCPMCRREIPPDYLEHPDLVQGPLEAEVAEESPEVQVREDEEEKDQAEGDAGNSRLDESRWFYEGRNGWWEYDVRTGEDLEQSFKHGEASCEMLIAGFLYIIDFQNMFQYRRNEPNRRRRIKRDLLSNIQNWKGVAGLRPVNSTSNENVSNSTSIDDISNDDVSNVDNSSEAIAQLSSGLLSMNLVDADTNGSTRVDQVRAVNDLTRVSSSETSPNPASTSSE